MGLCILGLFPNWNMLPNGGGVEGLKSGGMRGPLAKGGALYGPPGSLGCGGGVLRSTEPGQGLVNLGNALGPVRLEPAANGFRPRLGPDPKRLLESEGLWLRRSGTLRTFLEVSPSFSFSSFCFCFCSFLALFALRSSSSSEYSTW